MLTSNEMQYYTDEKRRERKGTIEGVDNLKELKIEGYRPRSVCRERAWEIEGDEISILG